MARKTYQCDAYARWNDCGMTAADCVSIEDRLILEAAIADGGKILRGQQYRLIVAIYDDFGTWRERIGMGMLCQKYDLYDDV